MLSLTSCFLSIGLPTPSLLRKKRCRSIGRPCGSKPIAPTLLFLDRSHEAEAVYLEHKDKPLSDTRNFAQAVKADFVEFRKFGIDTLEMKRIEALLPQ